MIKGKFLIQNYYNVVLAVAHDEFKNLPITNDKSTNNQVIFDIKSMLKNSDGRL